MDIAQLNTLFTRPIWTGMRSRAKDRPKRHKSGPWIHTDAYWLAAGGGAVHRWSVQELAPLHHEDLKGIKTVCPSSS